MRWKEKIWTETGYQWVGRRTVLSFLIAHLQTMFSSICREACDRGTWFIWVPSPVNFVWGSEFWRGVFIPMVHTLEIASQSHQASRRSRLESRSGDQHPSHLGVQHKGLPAGETPPGPLWGGVCSPAALQSLNWAFVSLAGEQCHGHAASHGAVIWWLCGAACAGDEVAGTSTGRCFQQQSHHNGASKPASWLLLSDRGVRLRGCSAALATCFPAGAHDEISLCAAFRPVHREGCPRSCCSWKQTWPWSRQVAVVVPAGALRWPCRAWLGSRDGEDRGGTMGRWQSISYMCVHVSIQALGPHY